MRIETFLALALLAPGWSCMHDHTGAEVVQALEPISAAHEAMVAPQQQAFTFNIAQETCALYVAVRSAAFNDAVAFGRNLDDIKAHWNKCPGGTMVACAVAPTANGDTIITGIPLPY